MNPVIPETRSGVGRSFLRLNAYARFGGADELTPSPEEPDRGREDWTETLNLAIEDPDLASRIMAATALDSDRLKRTHHERIQAELPEQERKPYRPSKPSANHVFHYVLTWHPDDEPTLSRDEMMRCVKGSLNALGGSDLQTIVYAHRDAEAPHVHVMVNRVDTITGKIRDIDSNAARKLSRFALTYNRERGTEHQAPMREANAERRAEAARQRARGEEPSVRPEKIKRRSAASYQHERGAKAEIAFYPDKARALKQTQRALDAREAEADRALLHMHRRQWRKLQIDHRRRCASIEERARRSANQIADEIAAQFSTEWAALLAAEKERGIAFERSEASLLGRTTNILRGLGSVLKGTQWHNARDVIADTFSILTNETARRERLSNDLLATRRTILADQSHLTRKMTRQLDKYRQVDLDRSQTRLEADQEALAHRQREEREARRHAWRARDKARAAAWKDFVREVRPIMEMDPDAKPAWFQGDAQEIANQNAHHSERKRSRRHRARTRDQDRDRER